MLQVKEFRQPTVRDAFQAIREEFGPSAVVLESGLVSARGWRGWVGMREVRVTAQAPDGWEADTERRPAVPERRPADTPAPASSLAARLAAAGIDPALADSVAAGVPVKQQRNLTAEGVRQHLATYLTPHAAGGDAFARVEVFVGPPGVGKTTTIAKIAARERAARGRAFGMIAADGFRAGAVEQLRTYADIIGSPFKVARTPDDLDRALSSARNTVLVDTAGRSPRDGAVREQLDALSRHRHVRTHLVIAADTSLATARRIFDAYADVKPSRIVVTKLDETDSLAPLSGLIRERGIPVSYITTGQRVPEDLERATPALLASAILRESFDNTADLA